MTTAVLHILPEDGIGGAELAAKSAARAGASVHVLFGKDAKQSGDADHPNIHYASAHSTFSLRCMRATLRAYDHLSPDVVVFSLWKCLPLFVLLRLLRPRMNAVLMLHSATNVHFVDYTATRLMQRLANVVWADSHSSLKRAVPSKRETARVLSFMLRRPPDVPAHPAAASFVYWGRINASKNLQEALRLFALVLQSHDQAHFTLVGPDDGDRTTLEGHVAQHKLTGHVTFAGPKSWDQIVDIAQQHRFFLQLSRLEGMAMSVVEAMQLGLVPVVTPVGEIANYCRHLDNGIVYTTANETADIITTMLENPETYARLSSNARAQWHNTKTYAEDFLDACAAQAAAK